MVPVTVPAHRLSVEDVYRMVEAGVLDENDRVELVEGVLVDLLPIGAQHDGATEWLTGHFAHVASEAWRVRVQSVLLIAGGYLLPDQSSQTHPWSKSPRCSADSDPPERVDAGIVGRARVRGWMTKDQWLRVRFGYAAPYAMACGNMHGRGIRSVRRS